MIETSSKFRIQKSSVPWVICAIISGFFLFEFILLSVGLEDTAFFLATPILLLVDAVFFCELGCIAFVLLIPLASTAIGIALFIIDYYRQTKSVI